MAPNDIVTTVRSSTPESGPVKLYLLVLRGDSFDAHPLPDAGEVHIGRNTTSQIVIDHPSISRNHATIHLGPPLAIQDLGSANGTYVADKKLPEYQPVALALNETIVLGSVTIILQRRSSPIRAQRIHEHGYFETRLAEECVRAKDTNGTFAVLRIRCVQPIPPNTVRKSLLDILRPYDIAAQFGPQEYEILLVDAELSDAKITKDALHSSFGKFAQNVRIGAAMYPSDGHTEETLLARAGELARDRLDSSALILKDPAMKQLYELAERVASGNISVLISGETGVGKEVLAAHIHKHSPRSHKPFLELNCAALTDSLFQSELFGHEKGAFTGAQSAKPGLLETADEGTVFLDEIGELTMAAQVKLLRVLEDQKVLRVGGIKPRKINVRVIAATNRNLEDKQIFREDLYYRIAGATLVIPPLRERVEEIVDLANFFLARSATEINVSTPTISAQVQTVLEGYTWPGNIRELRNMMERAVLLSQGNELQLEHLPVEKMSSRSSPRFGEQTEVPTENPERTHIVEALTAAGGNQTEAAKILGISRRTLAKRLELYGIPRPRKR